MATKQRTGSIEFKMCHKLHCIQYASVRAQRTVFWYYLWRCIYNNNILVAPNSLPKHLLMPLIDDKCFAARRQNVIDAGQ